MFWVCAQEDEAVPRELVRDRFLQLTHHSVRGEIAIHWDDEAKPVATIPRVLDGNICMWHTGQLSTRTHPHPHWILCFPWTLGAQSFSQEDTGVWQAVRTILCSVHSTQPGGQARGDSQAGSWNPIWQLAFSFLFTCCINFVAIFAFWGSLCNLWWCNKTQVTCRFWVCRWLCFRLFHFKEDSETASETGN